MAFTLDSDGFIRGTLDGRQYVGRAMVGGKSDAAYYRFTAALLECGFVDAAIASAKTGDNAGTFRARVKLATLPDVQALVRETLEVFTVGGLALATEWEKAFTGRGREPYAAAVEVWEALGFFVLPGVTPPKREQPSSASPPVG